MKKEENKSGTLETILAPFVYYETVKNSVLSAAATQDLKKLRAIKNSLKGKDIPRAITENQVEGIDVIMDAAPELTAKYPSLAAAAGLAIDFLDPVAQASRGVKAIPTGINLAQKLGKSLSVKGAEKFVKSQIPQADRKQAEKIIRLIKERDLYKKLDKPEQLAKEIAKEVGITGAQIESFVKNMAPQAKKINRKEVVDKLVANKAARDRSGLYPVDETVETFRERMTSIMQPTKKVKAVSPPKKVVADKPTIIPPIITTDLEDKLERLAKLKDNSIARKKAKDVEIANYEKSLKEIEAKKAKAISENKTKVKDILETQEKEILSSKKAIEAENKKILAENAKIDSEVAKLKGIQAEKKKKIKVTEETDLPEEILAGLSPKERLKIEADNIIAKENYAKALKQKLLPRVKDEDIAAVAVKKKPLKEFKEPGRFQESNFDLPVGVVGEVVPPAKQADDLPKILREMQKTIAEKSDIEKQNKFLEQTQKADLDAYTKSVRDPDTRATISVFDKPIESDIAEIFELKKNINKEARESSKKVAVSDIQGKRESSLVEAGRVYDDVIEDRLSQITLPDGSNAKDYYNGLQGDYNALKEFEKFLVKPTMKEWREKSSKWANAAGLAVLGGASAVGLPIPVGMVAGAAVRQGAKKIGEGAGKFTLGAGNALQNPVKAAVGLGAVQEGAEFFGQPETDQIIDLNPTIEELGDPSMYDTSELDGKQTSTPQPQEPNQNIAPIEAEAIVAGTAEGEAAAELDMDPAFDKINQTLAPQPMRFNPYVNELVLNTRFPRDTQRILANPEALRAKMSVVAPQQLPMLEDMLGNSPELLADGLAKIAGLVPHIFEDDKYGSFDGKIKNPEMQKKFLNDLRADEALSSVEKARLATRVFRGEKVV
jgi:hypothetical protein